MPETSRFTASVDAVGSARGGLRLITWSLIALVVTGIITALVQRWALDQMWVRDGNPERAMAAMQLAAGIGRMATLLAFGLVVFGLTRLYALRDRGLRGALPWAMIASGLVVLLAPISWSRGGASFGPFDLWLFRLDSVAHIAAWITIAWSLSLTSRLEGGRPQRGLVIAIAAVALWQFGFPAGVELADLELDLVRDNPWAAMVVHQLGMVALAVMLHALARKAGTALGADDDEPAGIGDWDAAAAGLHTYASAFVARVVCAGAGILLLLMAYDMQSPDLARFVLGALPMAGVITGAIMAAGLYRFMRLGQPESAGTLGSIALVITGAAVAAELYVLVILLPQINGSGVNGPRVESLQQMDLAVQAIGVIGLLAVLTAVEAVARHLARDDLAHRASGLYPALVIVGGGVLGIRYLAGKGYFDPGTGEVVLMVAAIANVVVLLAFAKTAHRAAEAMREGPGPAPARAWFRRSS